jgi:hypothetical protein
MNYYAAKFKRERAGDPREWAIVPSRGGGFELQTCKTKPLEPDPRFINLLSRGIELAD